jgi:cation diffusion facilitator CzcD-associated flavoprotein CzcO
LYRYTEGKWAVKLSDGREARAEHLIVATGALGKPKKCEAADKFAQFAGEVIHSSEYYDSAKYHGKDVLVVGAGSSGIEISVDLVGALYRLNPSS